VAQRQRHQSKISFDLSDDKNATKKKDLHWTAENNETKLWGNDSEMCRREFGSWILYDSLLNDYSKKSFWVMSGCCYRRPHIFS
jgi:hypothetical protein